MWNFEKSFLTSFEFCAKKLQNCCAVELIYFANLILNKFFCSTFKICFMLLCCFCMKLVCYNNTDPLAAMWTSLSAKNIIFNKKILKILKTWIFYCCVKTKPTLFYAKNRTKLSLKLPISQCFTFRTFYNGQFFQKILT